jgi:sugar O-acyltransferase (sialic acid O-acetyltransferase NeuD family)
MKYVIFGSGGLAKELIGYIANDQGLAAIAAVVSTEPFNNPEYTKYFPVRSSIEPGEFAGCEFLLAVAQPDVKRIIVDKNEDRWGTYIHPSAEVSKFAKIGKGCVLTAQCIVVGDPVVEDFVFMNTNATIGHDARVGKWTTMFPNTEICGDCIIGENCIFGIGSYVLPGKKLANGVKVSAGSIVRHDYDQESHRDIVLQGNPARPRS